MHLSQRAAAQAISLVFEGQTLPDALAHHLAFTPPNARAFVQELSYGSLRHWGLLSAQVDLLSKKEVKPALLRYLLAVALYQLQFTRQPSFAIVNHAVNAAKAIAPAAGRFVNAVLRRFLREQDALTTRAQRNPVAQFSYPSWWIHRIQHEYPHHWQVVLQEGNQRPPLTLRVNTRATTRDALMQRFAAADIAAREVGQVGVILDVAQNVTTLPGYVEGWFSVQDLAAQQAAFLLDAQSGMHVLDACAAPGGKTAHLLELADLDVLAIDRSAARLTRVDENLARLKLNTLNVVCRQGDASEPTAWWDKKSFDRILVDAPCSASGVVRRHPDAKWRRQTADISGFAQTQTSILRALWPLLATGGRLLYVTCSLFSVENEEIIAAFCAQHQNAQRKTVLFPDNMPHLGGQLLPCSDNARANQDGLYFAIVEKVLN